MNKQNIMIWLRFALALAVLVFGIGYDSAFAIGPGDVPDYYATPNWANSPPLRKFVDTLPGLGPTGVNNLGQFIPIAVPDITTYPGSDYYEIELREYFEKMHTDMPPTRLRGYVQVKNGVDVAPIHYLGPLIIAQKDRPVRVKFTNKLPNGNAGKLFVPVDTTIMGSGEFEIDYDPVTLDPIPTIMGMFTQNRATLHLHGGRTPWISDGTPHQWITPAGEVTEYPRGISVQNVPDMPDPGPGSQTFYWTNQQSARLMFYHDHAWGITRLNVYIGEAAGYLLTDPAEQALVTAGLIPADQIPLVIQDKTFVDPATIVTTDPTWAWGSQPWNGTPGAPMTPVIGDLWWPHVYMPAQNPDDVSGINAMGRWMYGPWFWPPTPLCFASGGTDPEAVKPYCIDHSTKPNPYYDPTCNPDVAGWCQPREIPGTPDPSWGAEAFLDTMIVNGTVYPSVTVDPKQYRLRILNAAHDRFLNLQMYQAVPIIGSITIDNPGSGYTGVIGVEFTGGGGRGAAAEAIADPVTGAITAINLLSVGSGYTSAPTVAIVGNGTGAAATAVLYTAPTEVGMVPASLTPGFPLTWPSDGREGGVPDPATSGPAFIQIGTEGGFLPAPVLLENQPVFWNMDPTMFNVGNVDGGSLRLGPAERADVIVDFSKFAGKTLILYNDAPAAYPALDPHYDYYTGAPDRTDMGGAPAVLPGMGPNVRTIMQIKVTGTGGTAPVNDYNPTTLANLVNAFKSTATTPGVFAASQEPIIVGQRAYGTGIGGNSAYNLTFPNTAPNWGLSNIGSNSLSFMKPDGAIVSNFPMEPKSIHDEMGGTFDDYGRMSAKLGLEVPFSNAAIATFALQNYVDPPTEFLEENGVQIWKVTHNGVDTHPIHFHLFDVQIINRVGWDGFIRLPDPNELGWKDTVKIAPLEDTIVALRSVAPTSPFGQPDSIRPLNPMAPLGSMMGFSQIDPLTGADIQPPTVNQIYNFGYEYVWHCHILSHEENDMMRPIVFNGLSTLPAAPVLSVAQSGNSVNLSWTDGTPPSAPSTLGNPANEVGFRIERMTDAGGAPGVFEVIGYALANATAYSDATAVMNTTYSYRVFAYNAAGDSLASNAVTVTAPEPPLSSGVPQNGTVAQGAWVHYLILSAATDTELNAALTNLSADVDLYVRAGAKPTLTQYDCRPYMSGTTPETCIMPNTGATTWYIGIHGYLAGSYTLTATLISPVPAAPAITSVPVTAGMVGTAYSYNVTASGTPAPLFALLTSPPGMTINQATGLIQWAPSAAGNFDVSVEASNGVLPNAVQNFTIAVAVDAIPLVSGASQNGTVAQGAWVHYLILSAATDTELNAALTNLSADVDLYVRAGAKPTLTQYDCRPYMSGTTPETCIMPDTGATTWYIGIHGYMAGSYTLTATLISPVPAAPAITSVPVTAGMVGTAYSYNVTASGTPAPLFALLTSPPGMTINQATGLIQWTPSAAGNFDVSVEASNGVLPNAVQNFTIAVAVDAIPLASGASQNGTVAQGAWVHYLIVSAATDTELNAALTNLSADVDLYVRAGAKPTLTQYDCRPYMSGTTPETCIMPNTGATTWYIGIHGYLAGSYTLTATLISPVPAAPAITSAPVTAGMVGTAYSYNVTASGTPAPQFALLTSPPGMTINQATGLIQWTPSAAGNFDVSVEASNGVLPNAVQNFTIAVAVDAIPLASGASQNGTVAQGAWVHYLIVSAATDTELNAALTNLSADVDLYVRAGAKPTLTQYDCRPYMSGTTPETCIMPNTGATTWYIGIHGYMAGSYTVTSTLVGP